MKKLVTEAPKECYERYGKNLEKCKTEKLIGCDNCIISRKYYEEIKRSDSK